MDEHEREILRQRLMTYPGATREVVEQQIDLYVDRGEKKRGLVEDRRMSNAMAEVFLDRSGYPRPPGWHSVFFYPGSNRPRNVYVIVFFIAAIALGYLTF
ncbi:MAG: hypothetical protein CVT73_13970 [Alphaproteobacteria bacterium HGW-Alphaproteobacteria-12]|nr:MAG: hypothetical protein CVT73_13970 [Alphaproteobacteria bacterium HGW-Alphaproteobacteria-12]